MQPDPRKQAVLEQAAKQGAKMLTSDKASLAIAKDAKVRGPAVAIVDALKQAMQVMTAAAGKAGVQIPPDVAMATALSLAQLLVSMMVAAGLAKDPQALFEQVQQGLQGDGQPAQPAARPAGMLKMGGA